MHAFAARLLSLRAARGSDRSGINRSVVASSAWPAQRRQIRGFLNTHGCEAMNERSFRLRLSCRYDDPDNSVAGLDVEVMKEGRWETLDLGVHTPGFLLFVYTIFSCQHRYLRTNCAEKGFLLESATGSIDLLASEDWLIRKMHIRFDVRLKSGAPSRDDVDYIIARMEQCPVSKNLREIPDSLTEIFLR
jgi:hypothetical protein